MRPAIDLELQPLLKALRTRLEALSGVVMEVRDGVELHHRNQVPFLALDIRRDHLHLDLWLPMVKLEEARASGIARAHPFLENEAVRVRFERAEDLTKVAHWLEEAYRHVPVRTKKAARAAAAAANSANGKKADNKSAAKGNGAAAKAAPKKLAAAKAAPKKAAPKKATPIKPAAKKAAPKRASANKGSR